MDAFQDHYPENVSHCYGCGHLNEHGHQIKTVWDGEETVTRFKPEPYHTSVPGYAYGGLIASLIDCHCTGTAAAAMYKQEGRSHSNAPRSRGSGLEKRPCLSPVVKGVCAYCGVAIISRTRCPTCQRCAIFCSLWS